jgi:peptide chain release factor subunit 1
MQANLQIIESIEKLRGRGTQLLTLFVPPDRPLHAVAAYLGHERAAASNIKSRTTRKGVEDALSSAISDVRARKTAGENGFCVFAGYVNGDEWFHEVVEPPHPVRFSYKCSSSFIVEPLKQMFAPKTRIGLVVIDWGESTIGVLRGDAIETLWTDESLVPRKHRMGGQSSQRFARIHGELVKAWYKDVASKVTQFLTDCDAIVIGGPGLSKTDWSNYLPVAVQRKTVAQHYDVGYTGESGLKELASAAADELAARGVRKTQAIVRRFLEAVAKDGAVCYGIGNTRQAVYDGVAETILIAADKIGTYGEFASDSAIVVNPDTDEGKTFCTAFGVGAFLRYKPAALNTTP